jgi:hypothetical protein
MIFMLYYEYHMPIPLCRNAHFFVHSGFNFEFFMEKLMSGKGWGINRGFIRLRQNTLWLAQRRSSHGAHAAQALTRCKRLRCMCAV